MNPEQSREFTRQLEAAALVLLERVIYRKPDDLARRFGLPVPVVRYWWRNTDQQTHPVDQAKLSSKEVKQIRKATQTLESWEKVKRYRPACGAKLPGGRQCKRSVAIRSPEGWSMGALADRCRMHGGHARRVIRRNESEELESSD